MWSWLVSLCMGACRRSQNIWVLEPPFPWVRCTSYWIVPKPVETRFSQHMLWYRICPVTVRAWVGGPKILETLACDGGVTDRLNMSITCHIVVILGQTVRTGVLSKTVNPRVPTFKVTQCRWNRLGSIGCPWKKNNFAMHLYLFILLVIHNNCRPVSYRFRDKRRFRSKIAKFSHAYVFNAPTKLVTSLVLSHLDYCNDILAVFYASTLLPLQRAQNVAVRLVLGLDCRSSITTALRDLHWLPVQHRITFKVTTLMH